jgi:hypothetical protein
MIIFAKGKNLCKQVTKYISITLFALFAKPLRPLR